MFSYPEVVVADPEMIKQMSIKEFDKFPDRQIVQSIRGIEVKGKTYKGLLISMGQEWRKRRQILSPAFTASKMKLVSACVWGRALYTSYNQLLPPPYSPSLSHTHSVYALDGALDEEEYSKDGREAAANSRH